MLRLLILSFALLASPALAQNAVLTMAQDHYEAGESVTFSGPAVTDLFLAGNRVAVTAPVGGSANLAGRRVAVDAPVTGDLFAAGYSVAVTAAVGGNATVSGFDVAMGPVTGNLRAAGSEVQVASVGGYALISGADVTLRGAVAGDVVMLADRVTFASGATVAGTLKIYAADPARIKVPETVAPASRVSIAARAQYSSGKMAEQMRVKVPVWRMIRAFLTGVLICGLLAALAIGVAPKAVQAWRELALAHPGRAIWSGFLVTSALAGSGFVLTLTLVGVILLPVMLVITGLAICAGYILGSYLLGVGLWLTIGRPMPEALPGKFGLACLGAFVAGLAWLVPIAGWFFVLGLTLWGIGTLAAFILPSGWILRRDGVMV